MKNFYTPNDFESGSDSERIQAAIAAAKADGCNKMVIPRYNKSSDSDRWIIDKTILLPSDITIVLDDCHMVMADGVMCRMFENENMSLPIGNTLEGEQKNINIIGIGNALLDGGVHNGLNEFTSGKNGMPLVTENLTICLHNVADFTIKDITIKNQRWWAIKLMFVRRGTVSGIRFVIDDVDSYGTWRNQDGIDLRVGCNNILIENISGEVGDDCIALTALMNKDSHEYSLNVKEKDSDIHDIIIRDVRAITSMCAIIRLLNQHGHKIYNITMDNIMDISTPVLESKTQKVLRIGEDEYYKEDWQRSKPGSMYNISISNVYSRALSAVHLEMAVKNLHVSNVFVHHDGQYAVTFGRLDVFDGIFMYIPERWEEQKKKTLLPNCERTSLFAENVLIENIYYTADGTNEKYTPAVCGIYKAELKNVVVRNVHKEDNVRLAEYFGEKNSDLVFE